MNGSDGDRDLADVFRDAAASAPPPRFDHADVVRTSDRITARRRTVLRGGVAALVVLAGLGGVGGAIALQGRGVATSSAASAPAPESAGSADDSGGSAPREASPVPMAAPPAAASGAAAPLGPGRKACADRQDPALRALVEQVLPDVTGAPAAATSDVCRPGGDRYISVEYRGDVLTVGYLQPGSAVSLAPGSVSAPTASGGTVLAPAAYPQLLSYLAPRL